MTRTIPALFVLIMAVASGCGGTPGSGEAFQPAILESGQAVIYVFRASGSGGATAQVYVDQEHVGDLKSGQYLVRIVEPGEHFIRADAKSSMARSVELVAGEAAYVSIAMHRRGKPFVDVPEPDLARRIIAGSKQISTPAAKPPATPAPAQTPAR